MADVQDSAYAEEDDEEEMEEVSEAQKIGIISKSGGQAWRDPEWVDRLLEKMLNYTTDFVGKVTTEGEVETWVRGPKAHQMAFHFNRQQ
jgi:hypothetical protein